MLSNEFEALVQRKAEKNVNRRIDMFMRGMSELDSELIGYVPISQIRENFTRHKDELIEHEKLNIYHSILEGTDDFS